MDQATWQAIGAAGAPFTEPWSPDEPREADLHELIDDAIETTADGEYEFASVGPHRVHVLVHQSHSRPLAGADVNVLLLRRERAAGELVDAGGAIALTPAWRTAVVDPRS